MITVVVGQRGTGKTHFLNRIKEYKKGNGRGKNGLQCECIDLDHYIEKASNMPISEIFKKHGEAFFRNLEQQKFTEILEHAQKQEQEQVQDLVQAQELGRAQAVSQDQGNAISTTSQIRKVNKKIDYYIAVGGGFDCALIPKTVRVLWLRRVSEQWGRIFPDHRPRLNPELTAIEEFLERARHRAEKFAQYCWEEYLMPEGLRHLDKSERAIVLNEIRNLQCGLTILPGVFKKPQALRYFFKKRLTWGLKYFEVRDDLLNKTQYEKVVTLIPKEKLLFSLRTGKVSLSAFANIRKQVQWIDCDQTLIDRYPAKDITIVSRHHRIADDNLESIFAELKPFEDSGHHVKLAVVIDSFDELEKGHQWFLAQPKKRSFLPRSTDGRWYWYRLMMCGQMYVEFIREGEGSAQDQPTLYQWIYLKSLIHKASEVLGTKAIEQGQSELPAELTATSRGPSLPFAALLGSPVSHSFTPVEQTPFFTKKNMPVYAIECSESDFNGAMRVLVKMGLQAAAVTSPLKKIAFEWVDKKTPEAIPFESVNTLIILKQTNGKKSQQADAKINTLRPDKKLKKQTKGSKDQLGSINGIGTNTDLPGLVALLEKIKGCQIAVWGGGGTLPLIQKLLPEALYFSAQTGQIRLQNQTQDSLELLKTSNSVKKSKSVTNQKDLESRKNFENPSKIIPEIVIWAAPRADGKNILFPPSDWHPKKVIDLNYREDSGGRDYALKTGATYVSGEKMFYVQAEYQRHFWEKYF